MTIRKSTEEDIELLRDIIVECFGNFRSLETSALTRLKDRYLMGFVDGELACITGILRNSHNDLEIDWTCTRSEYRGQGLMHALFSEMFAEEIKEDVLCSCWKLSNQPRINLFSLMRDFGFKEIMPYYKEHNCSEEYGGHLRRCPFYLGAGCTCSEDWYCKLYIDK